MNQLIEIVSVTEHPVIGTFMAGVFKELAPDSEFAMFSTVEDYAASKVVARVLVVGAGESPRSVIELLVDLHEQEKYGVCVVHSVPKFYRPPAYLPDYDIEHLPVTATIKELYLACDRVLKSAKLGVTSHRGAGARRPGNEFQSTVARDATAKPLTNRQVEIMELIIQGHSAKEVAKLLTISPDTVRGHLKDVFVRLGVKNIAQAVEIYGKAKRLSDIFHGE